MLASLAKLTCYPDHIFYSCDLREIDQVHKPLQFLITGYYKKYANRMQDIELLGEYLHPLHHHDPEDFKHDFDYLIDSLRCPDESLFIYMLEINYEFDEMPLFYSKLNMDAAVKNRSIMDRMNKVLEPFIQFMDFRTVALYYNKNIIYHPEALIAKVACFDDYCYVHQSRALENNIIRRDNYKPYIILMNWVKKNNFFGDAFKFKNYFYQTRHNPITIISLYCTKTFCDILHDKSIIVTQAIINKIIDNGYEYDPLIFI